MHMLLYDIPLSAGITIYYYMLNDFLFLVLLLLIELLCTHLNIRFVENMYISVLLWSS